MDFGPLAFGQISIERRFSDNPQISLRSTFSLECLNDGRATLEEAFWGRAYNASKTVVLNDTDLTSAKRVPSIRDNHVTRLARRSGLMVPLNENPRQVEQRHHGEDHSRHKRKRFPSTRDPAHGNPGGVLVRLNVRKLRVCPPVGFEAGLVAYPTGSAQNQIRRLESQSIEPSR